MGRILQIVCGCVLAVGLCASAPILQPQKGTAQEQQEAAQPEGGPILEPSSPSEPSPKPLEAACEKGDEKRYSDLCAQWRAADAARESAFWTAASFWAAFFGLIVGAVTVSAAVAAALFARDAADHTKRSADAAEAALATENRAWLIWTKFNTLTTENGLAPDGRNLGMAIGLVPTFNNFGSSPAMRTEVAYSHRIVPFAENVAFPDLREEPANADLAIIAPGLSASAPPLMLFGPTLERFLGRTNMVLLRGFIWYSDISSGETDPRRESVADFAVSFNGWKTDERGERAPHLTVRSIGHRTT